MAAPMPKRVRLLSPQHDAADHKAPSIFGPLDPDRYYPIYASLMRALDSQGVTGLCRASKEIRNAVMSREWDTNARLQSFIKDPVAFRTRLGRCNALIFWELRAESF
jgi:hypothetical protein